MWVGGTDRDPPMHSRDFAAKLARVIFTNGKADCELVAGLYADTMAGAFGSAESLVYNAVNWNDAQTAIFAKSLHLASSVKVIDLRENNMIRQASFHPICTSTVCTPNQHITKGFPLEVSVAA